MCCSQCLNCLSCILMDQVLVVYVCGGWLAGGRRQVDIDVISWHFHWKQFVQAAIEFFSVLLYAVQWCTICADLCLSLTWWLFVSLATMSSLSLLIVGMLFGKRKVHAEVTFLRHSLYLRFLQPKVFKLTAWVLIVLLMNGGCKPSSFYCITGISCSICPIGWKLWSIQYTARVMWL